MLRRTAVACACIVAACAPMSTSGRIKDVPRPDKVSRSAPEKGTATLSVTATPDGILIASTDALVCREQSIKVVARTEIKTRKVNKPVVVIEYIIGLGLAAAGAFAIAAPQDAIDISGAPVDTPYDQVRTAGGVTAGVGGLFLILGVANSFRGGTSHKDLGLVETPGPAGPPIACGSAPRAGDPIVLAIGSKNRELGKTDGTGALKIAFDAVSADAFDGDWKAAKLVGPAASTPVDLTAARDAVAVRELAALSAAPSLEAARTHRTRFGRGDKIDALVIQLADTAYAAPTSQALASGDLETAKSTLAKWSADAPDSAMLVASRAEVAELERLGPAEYLHARFVAASATASTDRQRYVEAERAILELARIAPADARIAPAQKKLKEHKKALISQANKHVDQAKVFAGKKQWVELDVELGKAKELAFDDPATLARIQRAEAKRPADTTAGANPATEDEAKAKREEAKARLLEAAKAKREEEKRLAAEAKAKREEVKARLLEAAKAKRVEEERLAADAKAKREEAKARLREAAKAQREEKERLAAEAKAEAAEEKARLAAEKARTADEKKAAEVEKRAAAAETARLAAEKKARKAAEAKKAADAGRLAAAAERARKKDEEALKTKPGHAPVASPPGAMPGLWAATLGNIIWLLELAPDGTGKTALFMGGHITAMRDIRWKLDGSSLSVATSDSKIRGPTSQHATTLGWLGVAWRKQ